MTAELIDATAYRARPGGPMTFRRFLEAACRVAEDALRFTNLNNIAPDDIESLEADLHGIETGGFSDEKVGGQYGREQMDPRRVMSREIGYRGLAALLQRDRAWTSRDILLDGLAGNGTFDRVMARICDGRPRYVGNDVSLRMASGGLQEGKLILWSDLRTPLVRDQIADYAVAAYGTHHVPPPERVRYAAALARRLRDGGTLVLQDFVQGTPSARWYSEFIHDHRSGGHPYQHFTETELRALFRQAGLRDAAVHTVFDPFVIPALPDQSDDALRQDFARYMRTLYALDRLDCDAPGAGAYAMVEPYFRVPGLDRLADGILAVQPFARDYLCEDISIRTVAGRRVLIAPRVAIAAAGTR